MLLVALIAVLLIVIVWLDLREETRPVGGTEDFYDSGALMRMKSTPTTIEYKRKFDPRSLKDPRFFSD